MAQDKTTIALIGFDGDLGADLNNALSQDDQFGVVEVPKQLSAINGQAVMLSTSHDIILFRTEAGDINDLNALEKIRTTASSKAQIVAVTNANASLETAHKLAQVGADHVLPDTMSATDMVAQLQKRIVITQTPQVAAVAPQSGAKIFTVARARGGSGGTTFAVNLADALLDRKGTFKKEINRKVAILDFDLQFGKVAGFLDTPVRDGLYQMAIDQVVPDTVFLDQSMAEAKNGVTVLSAPSRFAPLDAITPAQISAILETVSKQFDYVVVDLPMALVNWVAPIMQVTDTLYMVTDSSVPSIQQARRLMDFFREDNPSLSIDVVINNEKKPLVKGRHIVEASKVLERPLDIWLPPDPHVAREAIDRGVPLGEVSGRSPLNKAIRQLGRKVLQNGGSNHAAHQNA